MDGKHGRTTSGVTCRHRLWIAYTVERRWAWHAIITFGQHKRFDDIGRGMPLSPLGGTHGRTTSGVACHLQLWAAHTVEGRRAWNAIITFGQHTQSKEVERGMTSPPFYSRHGRTTLGVTCHPHLWTAHTVERRWRDMPSPPLHSTHDRTTPGMACHHHLWAAQTVGRHRAWHAIVALER